MTGFFMPFFSSFGYILVRLSATLWKHSPMLVPDFALTSLNPMFRLLQNSLASWVVTFLASSGESNLLPIMNSWTFGMAYFSI